MSVLQQEVADSEAVADTALYLPVCNPEADTEEGVYPFDERILLCSSLSTHSILELHRGLLFNCLFCKLKVLRLSFFFFIK